MLKYSVQSRLFAILWTLKTIHKEEPMYAVLDKVTIKSEIMPCLSTAKRGFETNSCLIEIIVLRDCLDRNGVVANICISKRRTEIDHIFIDEELYAERYSVERTNAWMDSYRTLLNRFDTTVSSWESWNYLAFAVLLLKKISRIHEKEKFKSLHILNTLFDNSSNLLYVFVFKCYPFSLKLMMTSSQQICEMIKPHGRQRRLSPFIKVTRRPKSSRSGPSGFPAKNSLR